MLFRSVAYEFDKELIGVLQKDLPEGSVPKAYIKNNTYLEEILEINDKCVCKLPDERLISIDKTYLLK